MSLLTTHVDHDELPGGRFRDIFNLRRVAYREAGALQRTVSDWQQGDGAFPHVITRAPMLVYATADGDRRICPTRDPARWVSIGAPYIKPGTSWQKVSLGQAVRSQHTLTWTTAQAIVQAAFGGHFIKLSAEFLGGWRPPGNQIAFPVGMQGLTRDGFTFVADGVPVMSISPMHVEDAANHLDIRPVDTRLVQVGGQWYVLCTLPSLAGMARPVLDPTLTLQPDAADGMDAGIRNDASNFNIGAATYIGMGHDGARTYRGLIKFNLADLPATAVISSAVLSLWCGGDYAANARTFRVYRQKRAWVEGNKVNADDTPASGATWARYDTTNAWQTAGGFGANDCEQTDIGSRDFTAAETLEEWKDFPLTPTSKTALDLGNGWMIKPDTEISDHYSFRSSDYATAARRPKLVIVYTLPSCRRALRGVGS